MAFTDDESDAVTSESESVPSPNSHELSAAGSESLPALLEDIAAYDFGVRHTCRGRKITSWPPLSRKVVRNHKVGKEYPTGCTYPVQDCPLASELSDEAKERKRKFEACSWGLSKAEVIRSKMAWWKKGL
ncbi:hypothetical protein BPAE_0296g00070 [Botrytis paeoniae]|uniref:Uncharacterized protein n=1 Tax=Botrytis paeoniae TaxID=278948 RepID=A0A4Z1FG60_9HELO|nr:hypothetical protein BPAE_0296g00070 [Botrytis paeoniae]